MKKFLAALMAALLLSAVPVAGEPLKGFASYEDIAGWMGCQDAHVEIIDSEDGRPNAWFIAKGVYAIGPFFQVEIPYNLIQMTKELLDAGENATFIVLLHEVSHCLQSQQGRLDSSGDMVLRRALEWEADVMASNAACLVGVNGPAAEREFWDHVMRTTRYTDPTLETETHGSINQRIANIEASAELCKPRNERPKRALP